MMGLSACQRLALTGQAAPSRCCIRAERLSKRGIVHCSAAAGDAVLPAAAEPSPPRGPRLIATLQRLAGGAAPAAADEQPSSSSSSNSSALAWALRGGLGSLPLLLGAAPVALPPSAWQQLGGNYVFVVGFTGWFLAQFFKIFTKWYKTGVFSLLAFVDSGGTPSSHSSLCSSITTAVALQHGLGSSLFAVCVCFSVIVMYDAMGVRRHAGLQAEVLNAVVKDLLEGHPVSERKLKEVLGHTPRQVLTGAVLGLLVGLFFPPAWATPLAA